MSSGTGSPPGRDSDHDDNEEEVVVKAEDAADSDEAEGEEEFKLRSNGLQDAFKETPGAPTPDEEEAGAEGAEGIKDEEPMEEPAVDYGEQILGPADSIKQAISTRLNRVGWTSPATFSAIHWPMGQDEGNDKMYCIFAQKIKPRRASRGSTISEIERDDIVTVEAVQLRVVAPILLHSTSRAAIEHFGAGDRRHASRHLH